MHCQEVDMEHWARREHYLHFAKEVNCTCCLTANVDITRLLRRTKAAGLRFYTAFLYCVAKVVNAHDEFKLSYRWQEDKLILWDEVVPSHIVFHEDSETFTRICSAWDTDFTVFYNACEQDLAAGKALRGYSVPAVPENIFDVSCIPWLHYTAMSLHIPENWIYLAPIITWGKYMDNGGHILLPLTMQIHHAAADGFHIARFFREVEETAQNLTF